MKTIVLQKYIFHYSENMTYFYDERFNNVLFVRIFDKKNNIINYDGAQLIVYFNHNSLKFRSLWNIDIIQQNNEIYLKEKNGN